MAEDRVKRTWPSTPDEWVEHFRLVFADPNPEGLDVVPTLLALSSAVESGLVDPALFKVEFEELRASYKARVLPIVRKDDGLDDDVARIGKAQPTTHWWWHPDY
jgi:hypothetical protein